MRGNSLYDNYSDFAAMAFEVGLNLGEDFRHPLGCRQGVPDDLKIGPLSDKLECPGEIHVKDPTHLKQLEIIERPETTYPHKTTRHEIFVNCFGNVRGIRQIEFYCLIAGPVFLSVIIDHNAPDVQLIGISK